MHGGDPVSKSDSLTFRSPISKLLRFFYGSRNKWKAKCKEAKRENRSLKYRLAVMTESRNRWKAEVRQIRESFQTEMTPAEARTKKHAEQRSRGRRRQARLGVGAAG